MAKTPMQHAAAAHHIVPTFTYVVTLIALAILMGATIAFSYVNFGSVVVNNGIAMFIACIKGFLVMWIFMGLKWATGLTRLWAAAGFIVFSLMLLILVDVNARSNEEIRGWDGTMGPAMPRTVDPKKSHEPQSDSHTGFAPRVQG